MAFAGQAVLEAIFECIVGYLDAGTYFVAGLCTSECSGETVLFEVELY